MIPGAPVVVELNKSPITLDWQALELPIPIEVGSGGSLMRRCERFIQDLSEALYSFPYPYERSWGYCLDHGLLSPPTNDGLKTTCLGGITQNVCTSADENRERPSKK